MVQLMSDAESAPKAANVADCLQDPLHFSARGPIGSEIFAYDVSTGRSLNPAAPPLDLELAGELGADQIAVDLRWTDPDWGGAALDRVLPAGPCSLFQIRWKKATRVRVIGFVRSAIVMGGLAGGSMLLAFVFAVRPLVRRLSALELRSRALGIEETFVPDPQPHDDSVGTLARTLDQAHDRLLEAARAERAQQDALRRHLAQVAHDLRTPLSAGQLALEELHDAADESMKPGIIEVLDNMVYMDGLTNNLHLASRMRSEASPLDGGQTVDLGQIVDFVVSRFRILGRRHDIEVSGAHPDGPVIVGCDPAMAQQTIANLVHNAVVHGRAGGHCAVVLEKVGPDFELRVLDDGPGLSSEQFQALQGTDSGSLQPQPGGSGLGLKIARTVCERARWTLDFASNLPEGLLIKIRGPRVVTEDAAPDGRASQ